jgi:hypothetical protein
MRISDHIIPADRLAGNQTEAENEDGEQDGQDTRIPVRPSETEDGERVTGRMSNE